MTSPPSAGWFPDPTSRHQHRYFDGHSWTDNVANDGVQDSDPYKPPVFVAPPPPPPPPAPKPAEKQSVLEERPMASIEAKAPAEKTGRAEDVPSAPTPLSSGSSASGPWKRFRGMSEGIQVAIGAGLLIAVFAVIAAIGTATKSDDSGASDESLAAETIAAASPDPPPLDLDVDYPSDDIAVHRKSLIIKGSSAPGTDVLVDGSTRLVKVDDDGSWKAKVKLDVGKNEFDVTAEKGTQSENYGTVTITRKRTDAEIAADREQRRIERAAAEQRRIARAQRREAARQARIEKYKSSATTIPYNQLAKDPDRYVGDRVTYTGKILQIQEDEGIGGIMLLYVTDEGYDIWDDTVWVDYDRSIKSAEDDIITIYGTVTGEKSYETQIGGETFVPQIKARYIDEG